MFHRGSPLNGFEGRGDGSLAALTVDEQQQAGKHEEVGQQGDRDGDGREQAEIAVLLERRLGQDGETGDEHRGGDPQRAADRAEGVTHGVRRAHPLLAPGDEVLRQEVHRVVDDDPDRQRRDDRDREADLADEQGPDAEGGRGGNHVGDQAEQADLDAAQRQREHGRDESERQQRADDHALHVAS